MEGASAGADGKTWVGFLDERKEVSKGRLGCSTYIPQGSGSREKRLRYKREVRKDNKENTRPTAAANAISRYQVAENAYDHCSEVARKTGDQQSNKLETN